MKWKRVNNDTDNSSCAKGKDNVEVDSIPSLLRTPDESEDSVRIINSDIKRFVEKVDKANRNMLINGSLVISLISVSLYTILYAYNEAYYKFFYIPSSCISLDLRLFVKIVSQILLALSYVILIYYDYKAESIAKAARFRKSRIIIITVLLCFMYSWIDSVNYLNYIYIIAYILLSIIFELLIVFVVYRFPRRLKQVIRQKAKPLSIKEIRFILVKGIIKKNGRILTAIFIILPFISYSASALGTLVAYNQKEFQVIYNKETKEIEYVVFAENNNEYLVLNVKDDMSGKLQVMGGSFSYLDKTGVNVITIKYSSVEVLNSHKDYSRIQITATPKITTSVPVVTPNVQTSMNP